MAKYYNTFEFIGEVQLPKDVTKRYAETTNKDKTWTSVKYTMGVKEGVTNSAFLDVRAGHKPDGSGIVYTIKKDGEKLQIPFKDRKNPIYLGQVADFAKYVVDLETDFDVKAKYTKLSFQISNLFKKISDKSATDEEKADYVKYVNEYNEIAGNRHEFVSQYDFVQFIKDNIDEIKTHRIKVRGNYTNSYSGDKYYVGYEPKTIEVAREDESNKLEIKIDFYFGKDAMTVEEDIIIADGFVLARDSYSSEDKFFKTQIVSKDKKLFDLFKMQLTTKEKTYQHMPWICHVYNGAEQKEFSYDDLTDAQKLMVDNGVATIDQYRPRGEYVLGNNITEIRMVMPNLTGDFANGPVDSGLKEDEVLEKQPRGEKTVKNNPTLAKEIDSAFGAPQPAVSDDVPFEADNKKAITEDMLAELFG